MERQWLESCVHATQIAHTRGSPREDNEAFVIKQIPGMDNQLLVDLDLQEVTGNVCLDCVLNA